MTAALINQLDILQLFCGLAWVLLIVVIRAGHWGQAHPLNSLGLKISVFSLAIFHGWQALTFPNHVVPIFGATAWAWLMVLEAVSLMGAVGWLWMTSPRLRSCSKGAWVLNDRIVWLLVIFSTFMLGGFVTIQWDQKVRDLNLREGLIARARVAAVALDASYYDVLKGSEDDLVSSEYQKLKDKLKWLRARSADCRFTYLCRRRGNEVIIVADSEPTNSVAYSPPGQVYSEATANLKRALSDQIETIEGPYSDRWGKWISCFVPMRHSDAKDPVIFGFDVAARDWLGDLNQARRTPLIMTALVVLLFLALFVAYEKLQANVIEMRQLAREAQTASQAKGEFLAMMSHEVRTPINGILGMADLLEQSRLDPRQREMVGLIKRSGGVLLGTMNNILEFSKIEEGYQTLAREEFELRPLIDEVVSLVARTNQGKSVSVQSECAATVPARFRGDAGLLRQVLLNLVGNGFKFTDSGSVTVRVRDVETKGSAWTLRFEVTDTGLGIPHDKLALLFQAFQQADASHSRRFGGAGLGLVISRRLVEMMGGRVGVESQEAKGSTFWFEISLPVSVTPAKPETFLRVLVAQDHPLNRQLSLLSLKKLGCHAEAVASGAELLERLEQQTFDVVLFESQLIDLDGLTLAKTIRAREANQLATGRQPVRLIALVATHSQDSAQTLLASGIDSTLDKSPSLSQLQQALLQARC